ncbi:MAG: DUF4236 domain-containing protein, partial [Dehalococcoidia bacterium]|nr:DUF4236 domain-containing protein [Dehalococcoidia bacterium]
MPWSFRKSLKLGPGIRLNLGKKSASISLGGPGYRYNVSTTGRSTTSINIPGTGISYKDSTGGTSRSRTTSRRTSTTKKPPARRTTSKTTASKSRTAPSRARKAPPPPARTVLPVTRAQAEDLVPKPGFMASGAEQSFRKAVVAAACGDWEDARANLEKTTQRDTSHDADDLLLAYALVRLDREAAAVPLLERVMASETELPDAFTAKYMDRLDFQIDVRIVPGIDTMLPFDSAGAALLLAELYQRAGRVGDAAELIEGLAEAGLAEPLARVALAELYASSGRWEDAVRVTDGVTNTDDLSALTLSYRGAALGALGQFDESLVALREALKSRSRSAPVLHSARYHRARVYEEMGQPGRARQDYEAIYAQNPTFADVQARL